MKSGVNLKPSQNSVAKRHRVRVEFTRYHELRKQNCGCDGAQAISPRPRHRYRYHLQGLTGAHASDGDASHHVQPCDILSAAAAAATAHSEMANLTMNQLSGGQRLTKVSGVDNANEAMVTSALRVRCNAR